jgi:NAD+ synthase
MLDAIRNGLVEQELGVDDSVAGGYEHEIVSRMQNMLFTAEYKRRQAPAGVKTSSKSFGRDRRYPITNSFRER